MILSTEFILNKFNYVFKNEFNERKILHRAVDENWGRQVAYRFVSDGLFVGTRWGVERANELRNLSRTLLLLEDKDGNVQLFSFWLDFTRNEYGYSEIHKQSLYLPCLKGLYR
jgi:hypothetical protein